MKLLFQQHSETQEDINVRTIMCLKVVVLELLKKNEIRGFLETFKSEIRY